MTTWKVGAVAETSGLTVRTLHHWDEIGLFRPAGRSSGGQREYTEEDLGRLYVVLALRDLGLGLDSIRSCLEAGVDGRRLLAEHLEHLDRGIESMHRLRDRVAAVVEAGDSDGDADGDADVAEVLTLMRDARRREVLADLDEDEQAALAAGAAEVGPARRYLLEVEWPHLYQEVEKLRRSGATATDARVQRLVARMDELSAMFGGGNAGGGVRRAWRDAPAAMSGEPDEVAAPWRELAEFVESARTQRADRVGATGQASGRVGGRSPR